MPAVVARSRAGRRAGAVRDRSLRTTRRADRGDEGPERQCRVLGLGAGLPRRRRARSRRRHHCCCTTARLGSAMYQYNGDPSTLTRYKTDPRALPFRTLGNPPDQELIIGSAAGNEILASRYFGARHIDAVELNPVTVSLPHRPLRRLQRAPRRSARRAPAQRRRPQLPRAQRQEVRPHLVRRSRQLRGEQRGVVGRLRALRELPLHVADDRGQPAPPHARRHHGRAVRRARLHAQPQPHRALPR